MISFDTGTHRFNLRAAAIVLHEDRVLLHRLAGDDFWSAPGGRVEAGELAAQAVVRELREEIAESVSCGQLLWVVENYFTYRGSKHHEIGLYFHVQLPADSPMIRATGPVRGKEDQVALTYAWFERSRLAEIEVRPTFLATALAQTTFELRHYIHHEHDAP